VNGLIAAATAWIKVQAQARPAVQAGRLDQGRNTGLCPEAHRSAGRAAARTERNETCASHKARAEPVLGELVACRR